MAGDPKSSSKRKRPETGRPDASFPSKRAAKPDASSDEEAKQHSRKIIRAVYRRYTLLSSPDGEGQLAAFDALLDGCEGDPAARRLAARLVPRFAARFPERLDTAARAIMELSAWDGSKLPPNRLQVADGARLDALRGLADICAAAARHQATARTASSVILHLLRRSQLAKGRSKSRDNPQRGTEAECIRAALLSLLRDAPKAILAAAFDSLGYGSGELFEAARELLEASVRPTAGGADGDESPPLLAALTSDPDLVGWLSATVQAYRGPDRDSKLSELLSTISAFCRKHMRPEATPHADAPGQARQPQDPRLPDHHPAAQEVRLPGRPAKPQRVAELLAESTGGGLPRVESGELLPENHLDGRVPNGQPAGASPPPFPGTDRSPETRGVPAGGGTPGLPRPGGACSVVFECLWINGVSSRLVSEAKLEQECTEFGAVKRAQMLPQKDQALVFFLDMRGAIACYEGLNGRIRLARKPLEVRFCEDPPEVASRPDCPPRRHVWIALPPPVEAGRDAVLRSLRVAGLEEPEEMLRVGGAVPGLMLQFTGLPGALAAARILSPQAAETAQELRGRRRSKSPPLPGNLPRLELPDFATSTLWIGQVGPEIDERELIDAFERFGRVVGYKLLRGSHCGFIDYDRVESAAAARDALANKVVAGGEIRVEFKEEGRALGRAGPGGRYPRGRGRGRFDSFGPRHSLRDSPPPYLRRRDSPPLGSPPRARSPPRPGSPPSSRGRSPDRLMGRGRRMTQPRRPGGFIPQAADPPPGDSRARHKSRSSKWDVAAPGAAVEPAPPVAAAVTDGPLQPPPPAENLQQPGPASQLGEKTLPQPSWAGCLAKSGTVICSMRCLEGPRPASNGANGVEPLGWPSMLNVTLRSDIDGILRNLTAVSEGAVAVRRLVVADDSSPPEAHARFSDFCAYLQSRNRAGVVENLPPAGALGKRMMYLFPPSEAVARGLRVPWTPQDLMLLALIVPSAA